FAASARIERRDTHQTMHACLGGQQTVRIIALDSKRRRFYACLASSLFVEYLDLESFSLGPAEVHTKKHLGKILGISSAGAGLDRADGVIRIVLAGKQAFDLGFADFAV